MNGKLSYKQLEEAKDLYLKGSTYDEIAEKFGVTKQCIQRHIIRFTNVKKYMDEIGSLKRENDFLRSLLSKYKIDVAKC